MSKKPSKLRPSLLSASIATAFGALALSGFTPTVYGQDEALEEIVVTGSRIVRRDYTSNSPIITVDSEDFESQTGLNIESYLNQLPNYNPATTPTTDQLDVQITPINSVGIATISQRGFGANRSLTLIDGKRPVPINALMVTDLNQIPSAMIQRSETITGGASAVYGADAVAGVTNFILRDDFEGLEIDTQYGQSEQGDGEEYRISAIMGADMAGGRGNITIAFENYNREPAFNRERDFYTDAWKSPNTAGNFIGFTQGVNSYNCQFNCPGLATVQALFPQRGANTVFNPVGFGAFHGFNFNSDGTIWVNGSAGGLTKLDTSVIDGLNYTTQTVYDNSITQSQSEVNQLKYNFLDGYTSAPQERYSFMVSGNYDITDNVEFFSRATYAQSKTETVLAGNNAIFGWAARIPYDPVTDSPVDPTLDYTDAGVLAAIEADIDAFIAANPNPSFIPTDTAGAQHPVPAELAILLNARGNPTAPWDPQWNTATGFDPRSTENVNEVWQLEAGLNFDIPVRDWTGELYFSHGESSTYNTAGGNMSLSRYRLLAALPDYGRNAEYSGNVSFIAGLDPDGAGPFDGPLQPPIIESSDPEFGAADITCGSGFYDTFFSGDQRPSEDCIEAIQANLQSRTQSEQDIIELNFQGGLFDLPAGEVRGAVGYQYRNNKGIFNPDILQSQQSFTDQVVGVYPTGYLDASSDVTDYYLEFLVPIVSDVPGIQQLDLEIGARWSDYEHTDNETTYKYLLNWQVNDWARFRGGFNRATRAPNLGELFLNTQEFFGGGGQFGDACGWQSSAPWGASGAMPRPASAQTNPGGFSDLAGGQTIEGATSTYLICQEQMGPTGTFFFYTDFVGLNSGAQGGGFAWTLQEGNDEVTSETADTLTFGFILNSPSDNPWLSGFSLSMDWYEIQIEDAIQLRSIDYSSFLCYGTVTVTTQAEAAAQAATDACRNVPRSTADGGALTATTIFDNLATIETSGIDFGINWTATFADIGLDAPGGMSINVLGTWLDYYRTKQSPEFFDVETDWAGSLGPTLNGTDPGAYDYRLFTNFTYFNDNWSIQLRWRHLPSVKSAAQASQEAIIDYNNGVAAAGGDAFLTYTPGGSGPTSGPFVETGSYNVFALSFNWNINDMFTLRGGIDNLFDTEPEVTGATRGYPAGTTLTAVCGGAPGCVNPNNYSQPAPNYGTTNAGFYDTIGRRWFLGIQADF